MRRHPHSLFIVVEGPEGIGKSTLVERLARFFRSVGRTVIASREPTDSKTGRIARRGTISGEHSLAEQIALFAEDRRQHIQNVIGPALRDGAIVLVDRYVYSNIVYQGIQGASLHELMTANEGTINPDVVLLLEADVEDLLERLTDRRSETSVFDRRETLERLIAAYQDISINVPTFPGYPIPKFRTVCAIASPDDVFAGALVAIDEALNRTYRGMTNQDHDQEQNPGEPEDEFADVQLGTPQPQCDGESCEACT